MQKEMHYKDCLTNEMLLRRFTSQFDLVRYAINRATYAINSGKESASWGHNLAAETLDDIAEGYDLEEDNDEVVTEE
jgi:hypothetical protein